MFRFWHQNHFSLKIPESAIDIYWSYCANSTSILTIKLIPRKKLSAVFVRLLDDVAIKLFPACDPWITTLTVRTFQIMLTIPISLDFEFTFLCWMGFTLPILFHFESITLATQMLLQIFHPDLCIRLRINECSINWQIFWFVRVIKPLPFPNSRLVFFSSRSPS